MQVCGRSVSSGLVGERHLEMGGAEQGCEVMVEGNGVREDVEAVLLALWMMGGEEALCPKGSILEESCKLQVPSARSRRLIGRLLSKTEWSGQLAPIV